METLFKLISEHPDEKTLVFCQFKQEMDYLETCEVKMSEKMFEN